MESEWDKIATVFPTVCCILNMFAPNTEPFGSPFVLNQGITRDQIEYLCPAAYIYQRYSRDIWWIISM